LTSLFLIFTSFCAVLQFARTPAHQKASSASSAQFGLEEQAAMGWQPPGCRWVPGKPAPSFRCHLRIGSPPTRQLSAWLLSVQTSVSISRKVACGCCCLHSSMPLIASSPIAFQFFSNSGLFIFLLSSPLFYSFSPKLLTTPPGGRQDLCLNSQIQSDIIYLFILLNKSNKPRPLLCSFPLKVFETIKRNHPRWFRYFFYR
jgi:hypothetical protein